jgi:hypothetical protein
MAMAFDEMVAVMQDDPLAYDPFCGLAIEEPDYETHEEDTGDEEIEEMLTHSQYLPHPPRFSRRYSLLRPHPGRAQKTP